MAYLEQRKRDIEDFLPGKSVRVNFSTFEEDKKLLRKLARDSMYADPFSFIREIACNAYDACVENKSNKKPQVILQTESVELLENRLIFKDFGKGMSKEFMLNNYSSLGTSTKRNDPNQIGSRGLGRLSPLKYTDNYYVITRFEGVEYMWFVFLDQEDEISIKLVSEKETNDIGTEVIIPIKNIEKVEFELKRKLIYFPIEPIGWEFEKTPDVLFENEDGIVYQYMSYYDETFMGIILGGVFYSRKIYINGFASILKFNIGELTLPATREFIEETNENISKINEKSQRLREAFKKYAEEQVSNQNNLLEKYNILKKYNLQNTIKLPDLKLYKVKSDLSYYKINITDFFRNDIKIYGDSLEFSRLKDFFNKNPNVNSISFITCDENLVKELNIDYINIKTFDKIINRKKSDNKEEIWCSLDYSPLSKRIIDFEKKYIYCFLEERARLEELYLFLRNNDWDKENYSTICFGKNNKGIINENFIYLDDFIKKHEEDLIRMNTLSKLGIEFNKFKGFKSSLDYIDEVHEVLEEIRTYYKCSLGSFYSYYTDKLGLEKEYETFAKKINSLYEKYKILLYVKDYAPTELIKNLINLIKNARDNR